MIIDDPGGNGFVIERIWAYVAVHDDGDEGVVGAWINGMMTPLVAADQRRVESLERFARHAAIMTGKQVKLVRFDRRTEVETLDP